MITNILIWVIFKVKNNIILISFLAMFAFMFFPIKNFNKPNINNEKNISPTTRYSKQELAVFAEILQVLPQDLERKIYKESGIQYNAKNGQHHGLYQFSTQVRRDLSMDSKIDDYSHTEQHIAHLMYCMNHHWFDVIDNFHTSERGFRLFLLGFAPKYILSQSTDTLGLMYMADNGNIDAKYGNNDGRITIQEVENFYYAD